MLQEAEYRSLDTFGYRDHYNCHARLPQQLERMRQLEHCHGRTGLLTTYRGRATRPHR
jgi:hypothetical protein